MTTLPRLRSIATKTYDVRWPLADVRTTSRFDPTKGYGGRQKNKKRPRSSSGRFYTGIAGFLIAEMGALAC